jgi:hypothetical protein
VQFPEFPAPGDDTADLHMVARCDLDGAVTKVGEKNEGPSSSTEITMWFPAMAGGPRRLRRGWPSM